MMWRMLNLNEEGDFLDLSIYTRKYKLVNYSNTAMEYENIYDKSLTISITTSKIIPSIKPTSVSPSIILNNYNSNITYTRITYYKDGVVHRDIEPASILYENENIIYEEWYTNGVNYNPHGPASIRKIVPSETTFIYKNDEGENHRCDGPAIFTINKHDEVKYESYYLNSKSYYKDVFKTITKCVKNNDESIFENAKKSDLIAINVLSKFYNNKNLVSKSEDLLVMAELEESNEGGR